MPKLTLAPAARFARVAAGALALSLLGLASAAAQYYPPPGYYGGPPPGYYHRPPPPSGYYDDGYGGGGYGGGGYYGRRRAVYGSVCVTSRGTCQFEGYPIGTVCKCHIPGFGPKRGVVR